MPVVPQLILLGVIRLQRLQLILITSVVLRTATIFPALKKLGLLIAALCCTTAHTSTFRKGSGFLADLRDVFLGRILQAVKPLLRHYLIAKLRVQLCTGKHLAFTGQQGFFLSRKRPGLRGLFQNCKPGLLTPQLLTLLTDGVIYPLMLLQGAQLCLQLQRLGAGRIGCTGTCGGSDCRGLLRLFKGVFVLFFRGSQVDVVVSLEDSPLFQRLVELALPGRVFLQCRLRFGIVCLSLRSILLAIGLCDRFTGSILFVRFGNTSLLLRHIQCQSGRFTIIPEPGAGLIIHIMIAFTQIPDFISLFKRGLGFCHHLLGGVRSANIKCSIPHRLEGTLQGIR